tara:strand:+ start:170 stop:439 length:270 start_codon:yes stop_codon:yes gene_type:complete
MKHNLYSVYDKVAELYADPFTDQNDGTAIRKIQDLFFKQADHIFVRHPDNFELQKIGTWDDKEGKASYATKSRIIEFIELTNTNNKIKE